MVRRRKGSRRAAKGSSGRTLKAIVKKGLKGLFKTVRTGTFDFTLQYFLNAYLN